MSSRQGLAKALSNLDQFRIVSKDITRGTLEGGVFTVAAYALLALLLIAELGAFLRTTYQTNIVMDPNQDSLMQINFDILMHDLPCKYLKLGVWDKFGEERIESSDQLSFTPFDHTGQDQGISYTKEEVEILEKVDVATDVTETDKDELDSDWSSSTDHFKHQDFNASVTFHDFTLVNFFAEWCVHCRRFSVIWKKAAEEISEKMEFKADGESKTQVKMMKMNCVDFQETCQEIRIRAFPSVRLYKRDGSFQTFKGQRTKENLVAFLETSILSSHTIVARHHSMFNEGCQVRGALQVPRVPGHFFMEAVPNGNVSVNPSLTNVSHTINHLSFGDREAKSFAEKQNIPRDMLNHITPLDGRSFYVSHFHEAPQHYLKVVSTHVQGKSKVFYQMTHTDRVRRLRVENITAAPQARFTFDFSPMSVVVKPKSKRWYEFLTSLFAILGGTYTIVELTRGAVDTVSTAVKEALGKAN